MADLSKLSWRLLIKDSGGKNKIFFIECNSCTQGRFFTLSMNIMGITYNFIKYLKQEFFVKTI